VVIAGRRREVGEAAAAKLRRGGGPARFFITGAALPIDGGSTAQ
jgi:hypothetical protein